MQPLGDAENTDQDKGVYGASADCGTCICPPASGDPEAVLVLDETGFLNKGRHSAGVARQFSGTAGQVANCEMGVFVSYASDLRHVLLDQEVYLPEDWTDDRERCQQAGIPEDRHFATNPQLAPQMLT
jgi:SRSO17 transposase